MPDFSKVLINLGARWQSAQMRRQLNRRDRGVTAQNAILKSLLGKLASTELGTQIGLKPQLSPTEFRQQIPLSDPPSIAAWVERARAGHENVMWPGRTDVFAATAGTTTGTPHLVPISADMGKHFEAAARAIVLHANVRAENVEIVRGRLLIVAGLSTAFPPLPPDAQPDDSHPLRHADLASLALAHRSLWAAQNFVEPTARIALCGDWNQMVERIIRRTRDRDLTLIAGQPQWLVPFAQTVLDSLAEGKRRYTSLRAVWPNLRCIVHYGSNATPITSEIRRLAGSEVLLHEVFGAAEGIYAIQGPGHAAGLRLLTDAGIYFEFLPLAAFDTGPTPDLATKAVPLADVETKTDYLLVVTTPAGLVRHVTGDIVRFTQTTPPSIIPRGQLALRLTQFGESLIERDLIDVLQAVCQAHKWQLSHFHVAPLPTRTEFGRSWGSHEWWIELQPGSRHTPTGPRISETLDRQLSLQHPSYAAARATGSLGPPIVRLVMPGAFQHWMRHVGLWGGPHKLATARNDRLIADTLARMARFSHD